MDESDSRQFDLRDGPAEIDLTDRLRFAAGALAADFGDRLPADLAEALVFSSAQGLLVSASVTEFVPILAERRARQAIRSGTTAAGPRPAQAGVPIPNGPAPMTPRPADLLVPTTTAPATEAAVAPLLAVPESQLARLRDDVEQARMRVADWRARLAPTGERAR